MLFEASAATEEELMKKIMEHAEKVHNVKPLVPEDMMMNIKKGIKEESGLKLC